MLIFKNSKSRKSKIKEKHSQFILDREYHLKSWVRCDQKPKFLYRVWRKATFLTEDYFLTRENHERGATLYHICHRWQDYVFYNKVPKGKTTCRCGIEVPGGLVMLRNLRSVKA